MSRALTTATERAKEALRDFLDCPDSYDTIRDALCEVTCVADTISDRLRQDEATRQAAEVQP